MYNRRWEKINVHVPGRGRVDADEVAGVVRHGSTVTYEEDLSQVVMVPEGVTFAEVEQALAVCVRLGVLHPPPGGWILGAVSPGEGAVDLSPPAGPH